MDSEFWFMESDMDDDVRDMMDGFQNYELWTMIFGLWFMVSEL